MENIIKTNEPVNGNTPIKINIGKALLTQNGGWFFNTEPTSAKATQENCQKEKPLPTETTGEKSKNS
jgi:hypothetical protein